MNEPDDPTPVESPLDEVREAAAAVLASLRQLLDVAERVIEDPEAFEEVVDGGRAFVEGFVGGFVDQTRPAPEGDES